MLDEQGGSETWGAFHSTKIPVLYLGIPCAQWNGTFRLHKPDPSHHFSNGYCTCKQDSKQWYWGQQFCQIERDISVRLTEMTRPVKEDDLKAGPEYSSQTKPKWSVPFDVLTEISRILV